MPPRYDVRPVTPARWDDMARLFESKGCPHSCWCMPYRHAKAHEMDKTERRSAMRRLVKGSTPVGLLAYDAEGEPVGWCSVAPRETYPKLERSTVMPRVDDKPTWTILCLFVKREHRGKGVPRALVKGAIAYARENGARVVEAYPWDAAGVSSKHRGHSGLYAAAGFQGTGRRWTRGLRPRA